MGTARTSPVARVAWRSERSTTFTCEHLLTSVGSWTNEGTVTGTPPSGTGVTHTSNQVVVNVPAESSFTVEKKQKLAGEFTTAELAGKVGETVHYEIIVTNTGNVSAEGEQRDRHQLHRHVRRCERNRCRRIGDLHVRTHAHERGAVRERSHGGRATKNRRRPTKWSSRLAAQQVQAQCAINESAIVLSGGTGSKRGPFTVHISSLGIKQITFLLDGKKIKTLKSSQAKGGQFSLRIDPSKLHFGAHTLTVRTVMTDAACPPVARAAVFVQPHGRWITPKFTG